MKHLSTFESFETVNEASEMNGKTDHLKNMSENPDKYLVVLKTPSSDVQPADIKSIDFLLGTKKEKMHLVLTDKAANIPTILLNKLQQVSFDFSKVDMSTLKDRCASIIDLTKN